MSNNGEVYLDTYVLQQDMRIRMPKTILSNIGVEKGKTKFDIYLDLNDKSILLRKHIDSDRSEENE